MTHSGNRNGDAQSLGEELLSHRDWVRQLARNLIGEDGDDLAQDVALAALERTPAPIVNPRAWLRAVTRKRAARHLRDRQRRADASAAIAATEPEHEPAQIAARLETERRLVAAVTELAEPYRSTIVERFFDGASPAEIARRRGVPAGTVRVWVHRGLDQLRRKLAETDERRWRSSLLALAGPAISRPLRSDLARVSSGVTTFSFGKLLAAIAAISLIGYGLWSRLDRASPLEPQTLADSSRATPRGAQSDAATDSPTRMERPRTVRAGTIRVTIRDAEGRPIGPTRVLQHQNGLVRHGQTDNRGIVEWTGEPIADRPFDLLVFPPNRPPLFRPGATDDQTTISVPDGARVAGRLATENHRFPKPIPLMLRAADGWIDRRLPPALVEALGDYDLSVDEIPTTANTAGRFEFEGIPPDWHGSLSIATGAPYWLHPTPRLPVTDPTTVSLDTPREDLRLTVTRIPSVVGRVLDSLGNSVANASIQAVAHFADGRNSVSVSGHSDVADGRFELGAYLNPNRDWLPWLDPGAHPAIRSVDITVKHRSAKDHRRLDSTPHPFSVFDAGDIHLQSLAPTHLHIVDDAGQPVARARACTGAHVSGPSDRHGRLLVFAERDQRRFRLAAPGMTVSDYAVVEGAGSKQSPFRIALRSTPPLRVRTRLPNGFSSDEIVLRVNSRIPLFGTDDEPSWFPNALDHVAGTSRLASAPPDASGTHAVFRPDSDGTITLYPRGPVPSIEVAMLDRFGRILGTSAECIDRTLDVKVSRRWIAFHGRFATRNGRRCHVTLRSGEHFVQTTSDAHGDLTWRFAANRGRPRPLQVTVEAPGHAVATLSLRLGRNDIHRQVVLGAPHALEVEVRDSDGRLVDADIDVMGHGEPRWRRQLGRGRVRFERLAARRYRVRVRSAGRVTEEIVDPAQRQRLLITVR